MVRGAPSYCSRLKYSIVAGINQSLCPRRSKNEDAKQRQRSSNVKDTFPNSRFSLSRHASQSQLVHWFAGESVTYFSLSNFPPAFRCDFQPLGMQCGIEDDTTHIKHFPSLYVISGRRFSHSAPKLRKQSPKVATCHPSGLPTRPLLPKDPCGGSSCRQHSIRGSEDVCFCSAHNSRIETDSIANPIDYHHHQHVQHRQ